MSCSILPDNIDQRLLEALKDYPEIKRVFNKMDNIDIFIFGLGRADVLADWRNLQTAGSAETIGTGRGGRSLWALL